MRYTKKMIAKPRGKYIIATARLSSPKSDINQMHADGTTALSYLCPSDFYLWLIPFFAFSFALFATSRFSLAQSAAVPFYYAAATSVEPQISTLLIGVSQTVGQAVVSSDRKHVTLSMDPTLLGTQGIRTFTYQKSAFGFVGTGPTAAGGSAGAAPGGSSIVAPPAASAGQFTPSIAGSPSQIAPPVSALDKPGMVLIAPLER